MRDRLIELLGDFPIFHSTMKERWMPEAVERLADHLLSEGVIVPPVKLGSNLKVYIPITGTTNVLETKVFGIGVDEDGDMVKNKPERIFHGTGEQTMPPKRIHKSSKPKVTNFEKMKSIETEKEMVEIICRLYDLWLAFALNNESIKNGLIKWLKQEINDGTNGGTIRYDTVGKYYWVL